MRSFFALLVFYAVCTSSLAQLPPQLERILTAHEIPPEGFSVLVQAVGADRPILAHHSQTPRNPASTIKLLTTWAALDLLGPTYTWPTEVYFLGERSGSSLDGDLALKGYGDPYLVTEEFWKLLGAVRRTGLEEINGDLLIDGSFFGDVRAAPGEFDGQPYRTYNVVPSALLINFKAVRFQFLPDPTGREVVITADPLLSNLDIRNQLKLVDGPCRGYQAGISFDLRNPGVGSTAVFSGRFPKSCAPYSLSRTVLEHDSFTFGVFKSLWQQLGGRQTGGLRQGTVGDDVEPVLIWQSRPLAEVIRSINKYSNNVMTRQLLYTLGAEMSERPGTRESGVAVIRNYLAEQALAVDTLVIDNGAGLSRETRISAQLLGDVLQIAGRSPHGPEFISSLSIGGLDGTTRQRFDDGEAAGNLHLKTGRLDDVTALAGYVHAHNGVTYVVTAMVNATDAHRGPGTELLDELVRWAYQIP